MVPGGSADENLESSPGNSLRLAAPAGGHTADPGVEGLESWASSSQVRRSMQGNRARDTLPELAVRKLLHAVGLRYRVNYRPLPGLRRTADIVFTRRKVAVFIDGCFWHSCPQHSRRPKSNLDYWTPKLDANLARDADTNAQLTSSGWIVLRFWEHQDPQSIQRLIIRVLDS